MANGLFGGGDGSELSPYLIEDVEDFQAIKNFSTYYGALYFKQTKNLNFEKITNFQYLELTNVDLHYDGNNKSFENLNLEAQYDDAFVIYEVSSIQIKNIRFANINFKCDYGSSSLIGYILDESNKINIFENIKVHKSKFISSRSIISAILIGTDSSSSYGVYKFNGCSVISCDLKGLRIGALANSLYCSELEVSECEVLDCSFIVCEQGGLTFSYFVSSVEGNGYYNCDSVFKNSYAKGNILDSANLRYDLYHGGFIAEIDNDWGAYSNNISIDKCYLDNNLNVVIGTGSDARVGGFVGDLDSRDIGVLNISNSFLLGNFTINYLNSYSAFASLVLYNSASEMSINFENVKKIDSMSLPSNNANYSYLDNQITSNINEEQSKQKATYKDLSFWDFKEIWDIKEGLNTPFFKKKPVFITCKRVPLTNYRR